LGAFTLTASEASSPVLAQKIRRATRGFAQRHAETEKIFGVHINQCPGSQPPINLDASTSK
jgi:hypothetical protein